MKKFYLFTVATFLILSSLTKAQDITISFSAEGATTTIDQIIATNLSTNESVALQGTDILNLHPVATNIHSPALDARIKIVPNPINGTGNLFYTNSKAQQLTVQILDISGKIILKKTKYMEAGSIHYELSTANKGIYLVSVISGESVYSIKFAQNSKGKNLLRHIGVNQLDESVLKATKAEYTLNYNDGDIISYRVTSGNYTTIINETPTVSKILTAPMVEAIDGYGNYYSTVKIGDQFWLGENLKTTKYNDGTDIPLVTDNTEWSTLTTSAYCWYNNDETTNKNPYGALYNWYTIEAGKLCPDGWYVPSEDDWNVLLNYLGGESIAGGKLKEPGLLHWDDPNRNATNETSFTAVGSGLRGSYDGSFSGHGIYGYFWSSTEVYEGGAIFRGLINSYGDVNKSSRGRSNGHSVRCIKPAENPDITIFDTSTETEWDYWIIGKNGEHFFVSVENDMPQSIYYSPNSSEGGYSVFMNENGSPDYAVINKHVFIYGDYENGKIDVGVIFPDGSTQIFNELDIGTDWEISELKSMQAESDWWRLAGHSLGLASCAVSLAKSGMNDPFTVVGCSNTIAGITRDYLPSEYHQQNLTPEKLDLILTIKGCTPPSVSCALGLASTLASLKADDLERKEDYQTQYDAISAVKILSTESGKNQTGYPGQPLSEDIIVKVKNLHGTPLSSETIFFSVDEGSVNGDIITEVLTDVQGLASIIWTAGSTIGNQVLTVEAYKNIVDDEHMVGSPKTFEAQIKIDEPEVITNSVSNTSNSATCVSEVTHDGGGEITVRGVVWSENSLPTLENCVDFTENGTGIGVFNSSISNLTTNTTYYVRAYATNSVATTYGNQLFFTTYDAILPTVVTHSTIEITSTEATCRGEVIDNGGTEVWIQGVVWATSHNPTIENNNGRKDVEITTGIFECNVDGLTPNTTYYVRAFATNSTGNGYGEEVSFTTTEGCQNGETGTVTDASGNTYKTVKIGTQWWMAENLAVTNVPLVTNDSVWTHTEQPAYCWYDNDASYKKPYGALYNWYAVQSGNLCPSGWHVPSDSEWSVLINYLGGDCWENYCDGAGKLKEVGTTHWLSPNNHATNETCFTALPGGYRRDHYYVDDSTYDRIGSHGYWWSSSEIYNSTAGAHCILYYYSYIQSGQYEKRIGYSVRCIKD